MKKLILIAVAVTSLTSCYNTQTVPYSSYSYNMLDSTKQVVDTSSTLSYVDSMINAVFTIGKKDISFVMRNKTDKTMKILWDETLFIQNGISERVMHGGVKYTDRNQSMPASVIPPNTLHTDIIVPSNKVYYREGYYSQYSSIPGGWEQKDLFPESTEKGTQFSVYMPTIINGATKDYTFNFQVGEKKTVYKEERTPNLTGTFLLTFGICIIPLLFIL
jgi:hypothetical protein